MADWCALFVSLLALGYTIRESRRNNSVVIRLRDSACSYKFNEENGRKSFYEFHIVIQNLGIAIYHPQIALCFTGIDGFGQSNFPLKYRPRGGNGGDEFNKGMIAEFGIKSYELEEGEKHFLLMLSDCRKQEAAFCVYSQGFLAKEFRLAGRIERTKSAWNKFAWKTNTWLSRDSKLQDGRLATLLPTFMSLEDLVTRFVNRIRGNGGDQSIPKAESCH